MVLYCNAACKKRHRHKHKKDCEEHLKRAAENAAKLHDEKLFKQPPPLDDCPICMIRLPSLHTGKVYMSCCGKVICNGCVHAFRSRATKEEEDICPFCRSPPESYDDEEVIQRYKKRADLNDSQAIYDLGCMYRNGECGLPQDFAKALKLYHRAADLGNAQSYYNIGHLYMNGRGVDVDMKNATHYWELAAMGGNPYARHNLGVVEEQVGNYDRALKHYMIAARDGYSNSLENIKRVYKNGNATKDDYAKALRSFQEYLVEVKNDQRDEAVAAHAHNKQEPLLTNLLCSVLVLCSILPFRLPLVVEKLAEKEKRYLLLLHLLYCCLQ